MNENERIKALETGRNPTFIANLRARLNEFTGIVVHDAFWLNKGDLAIGKKSREAGRLPMGADGHVLTADSSEEIGLKWAAPGASGGGAKSVTLIVGPASNADSADYDYTTDGTDDDVQIQAAIDALPLTGGKVILREGTYTINYANDDFAEIISSTDNVHLSGMGKSTKLIYENGISDDASMLWLIGSNCKVTDISFDGNRANADGGAGYSGTLVSVGDYGTVSGCYFQNARGTALAISSYGTAYNNIFVDNDPIPSAADEKAILHGAIYSTVSLNVFLQADTLAGAGRYFYIYVGDLSSVTANLLTLPGGFDGVGIGVDGFCTVSSNVLLGGATEDFEAVGIETASFCSITGNVLLFSGGGVDNASVGIAEGGEGTVSGNIVDAVAGVGINVGYATKCLGNNVTNCSEHGIHIIGDDAVVTGNRVQAGALAADNTYSGIHIEGNRNVVTGNRLDGNATNDFKYGIREAGGDRNIIEHNIATGADTAQISTIGANTISGNNITT